MNQLDKNDNADLDKIDRDINFHRIMVFLILVTAIIFYMIFINLEVTDAAQSWGPVGDFFGGILNPIFALFAFYWLTYSVRLQIKELKETREELSKAAEAQEESAKHQAEIARLEGKNLELQEKSLLTQIHTNQAQQQQIAIQNFEGLFFQLLKAKNDITNDIKYFKEINGRDEYEEFSGKDAIKVGVDVFIRSNYLSTWTEYYKNKKLQDYMGSYFLIIYQILKLIDNNVAIQNHENSDKSEKQIEYFDIFKSTLNKYELEVLFFFCLSELSDAGFKKLVEKYGFFKSIFVKEDILNINLNKISSCAYLYDQGAYENSEIYSRYMFDLSKIKKDLASSEVDRLLDILFRINFIKKRFSFPFLEVNGNKNSSKAYIINKDINLDLGVNIFVKDNIEFVSQDVLKIYSEISVIEKNLNKYKSGIDKIQNYFFEINEDIDLFRKIKIDDNLCDSIDGLMGTIAIYEKEVIKSREKILEFETLLKEMKENDNVETVLILVKYGIDYLEFSDYMNEKEEIQQKKSA